jgi:Tol biopolymer transport system component
MMAMLIPACGGSGSGPFVPGVVYLADTQNTTLPELFVADLAGTGVRNLSGTLAANGQVGFYVLSPDRTKVAFEAEKDTPGVVELYVVPVTGGTPVKVSGPLVAGGFVSNGDVAWAPDGSRLAYMAIQSTPGVMELYSVNPDGTGNVKVSGALIAGGFVDSFKWSPDGTMIAYRAIQDTAGVFELYKSLAAGGFNNQISGTLVAGGSVTSSYEWRPDSSAVAYLANQESSVTFELYSTTPTISPVVTKLSGPMAPNGDVIAYAWAPDGSRIAYTADQFVDAKPELFTSLPDGTSNLLLSGTLTTSTTAFAWSPDSTSVAFIGAEAGIDELYVAPATGITKVKVNGPLVAGGRVELFRWAPDGSRIAYQAEQLVDDLVEIFTSLPDGTQNAKISGELVPGGRISFFKWAPNSQRIGYLAYRLGVTQNDLFTALADGSGDGQVAPHSLGIGGFYDFIWGLDSTSIVYTSVQDTPATRELYSCPDASKAWNRKLSGPMVPGGNIISLVVLR